MKLVDEILIKVLLIVFPTFYNMLPKRPPINTPWLEKEPIVKCYLIFSSTLVKTIILILLFYLEVILHENVEFLLLDFLRFVFGIHFGWIFGILIFPIFHEFGGDQKPIEPFLFLTACPK